VEDLNAIVDESDRLTIHLMDFGLTFGLFNHYITQIFF
jgi:hypothetical protein